jgi:phage gp36-like protein
VSYATIEQLLAAHGERLLVQLTDRATPPSGEVDTDVVAGALANTDAVIDGYLAGRYVLPLTETPPLLVDLAIAIAVYKLHSFVPDAKIDQDYRDAIATLGKIATGVIRLPATGIEPASSGGEGVVATDRERDLTPENLKGFV